MKEIHIIGGGTLFHIRPHFALAAPAYGNTVWDLFNILQGTPEFEGPVHLYTTKMAGNDYSCYHVNGREGKLTDLLPYVEDNSHSKNLETNADVAKLIDTLVEDPAPKIIFMPVALCDFEVEHFHSNGNELSLPVGKNQPRLKTGEVIKTGDVMPTSVGKVEFTKPLSYMIDLRDAEKVIKRVREKRKDIFLVGFKTTTGATPQEQFESGLSLLKKSSCNLVLANDIRTRLNMVVTPEQAPHMPTKDREQALDTLIHMALHRAEGHFTRSVVAEGKPVPWKANTEQLQLVPKTLQIVVDHCIKKGAYKPFLGATVGHFAFKVENNKFVTSRRGVDFNKLEEVGMVLVETLNDDRVIAYGGKPSVGGQSQRIIFNEHPDVDCIVHFHCPMKPGARIPVREQWPFECGSHECGKNTSDGLESFEMGRFNHNVSKLVGRGDEVYAVMLDKHGPNIVFNRNVNPNDVIQFIDENFDLSRSTSEVAL